MSSKPMEVKKSRNADYALIEIAKLFEPASPDDIEGTCANIRAVVEPDTVNNWEKSFCQSVSAPYVLARLCALFKGLQIETEGQDGYKVTWGVVLKHTKTGHVLTFYDYKGGISYGSDVFGKSAPKTFIKDAQKLIKVLKNDRCPHPYDGCVVGEIA